MRVALLLLSAALAASALQAVDDPEVRAAVDRFYATQEAEDADAYLALWSLTAQRPRRDQLKYIFDSGDDKFTGITITRVTPVLDGIIVRVSVTRDRTSTMLRPDGSPFTVHSILNASLKYVREDNAWKLVLEGTPADALAALLIDAPSPEEREHLLEGEPDLVGPGLITAISRQATALSQQMQHKRAQAIYELAHRMAAKIGDVKLEADALQNVGNAMYFQRNFTGALAAFERRLILQREIGRDDGIASALLGIATVRYAQFEYAEALVTYREALAIQERLKEESTIATTLFSTGNIQYIQGDYPGAIEDYRRSRDLSRSIADTSGESRALEGLGRTFSAQGDFAAALESYSGVLADGRARSDRRKQGAALESIAEIHFRLGNLEAARPLFDEARGHFDAMKDLANVGRVWHATALTDLVAGRFAAAEREYGASGTSCAAAQDNDCVARATVGLAFAQASQDHFSEAVPSYRKAIAAFTALQKREDAARAEVGLSQALLGMKDDAAAIASAVHARDEGIAIRRDDVVWRARVAEARALRRISGAAAATAAAQAVAAIERMAAAALDAPGEPVPADVRTAYALLAVLQAGAGDGAAAFTTLEQGRGHALRATLATNERGIARGMTDVERESERAAAAEVISARALLDHEQGLPRPDADRVPRLQQRLASANAVRSAGRQQLFDRLPDLRTWRGLAAPMRADETASVLPDPGTAIVELVMDDDDLLAIIATRNDDGVQFRSHVTAITRRVVAERIARALDPSVLRSVDAWRRVSADLVSAFPAAAWSELSAASRAIVIPDGIFWRVPFEALPVGDGWLADRTSVTYAGSVTSLVRAPAAAPQSPAGPLLAVSSPDLPAAVRDRIASTAPGWTLRASDAADVEVRSAIAPFIDPAPVVLSGAAATEAAVRERAPAASMLHFAVPFRMNGESPLFSPMLLSSDFSAATRQTKDNDGVLETREVMNLDLHARVAVFSDGAATSMRDASPAADTVRWAWRVAGIPAIVLPRWAGDAGASSAWMNEMYKALQSGSEPDAALQRARAAMRADEDTRAPYFWAGWMLIGR